MKKTQILGLICGLLLTTRVSSAPLFPDVNGASWARDAVASLAERGLLEGYPDGTFKGDRVSSRWELAMVVGRALARLEQRQATLANRSDLDLLRQLARALHEELSALGMRTDSLESATSQLDQRVTELERITFYGELQTRVALQSFRNQGVNFTDPSAPLVDFDRMTGSASGAGAPVGLGPAAGLNYNFGVFGLFTVTDLKSGRPQTSGNGFTSRLLLGISVKLDPEEDLTAGMELVAFAGQGSAPVDAYYGVSAPYLSNPFTAISTITGGLAGFNPDNNQPLTRLTLDNFWVRHGASRTSLVVGAFRNTTFDSLVYVPQINPNANGPRYLDGFGVQLRGDRVELDDDTILSYELMGTRLPDRNAGVGGAAYFNHAEGLTVGLSFHESRGQARLNFLRAANEASGGAAQTVGLISVVNLASVTPWVNPPGFYLSQLGVGRQTAGIGSTSDVRPVPMAGAADGFTGLAGLANVGNIGPQDQTSYGASLSYNFEAWLRPRIFGEYAHSLYRPQKNSTYSASGSAARFGFGVKIPLQPRDSQSAEQPEDYLSLGLQAEYVSTDARYDPFVLQIPRAEGILNNLYRFPDFNYAADLYPLHDTVVYPHNREGIRLKLDWEYSRTGKLGLHYGSLSQKTTSMQDVRFSAGSLGGGAPNTLVLGHSPGFVEPVFGAFAAQTFAPQGSNLVGFPLENPRGRVESLGANLQHKWSLDDKSERAVTVRAEYQATRFRRDSSLRSLLAGAPGILGENINRVDLNYRGFGLEVEFDLTSDFTARLGYDQLDYFGHDDPFGVYGPYAVNAGRTDFYNFDLTQRQPHLGFDWKASQDLTLNLDFRYLITTDHVSASVFPTPTLPSLNLAFSPQTSAHPFNWSGYRLNAGISYKF